MTLFWGAGFLHPSTSGKLTLMRVIFWFRRDLRLADNMGLTEATKLAKSHPDGEVLPVFVLDPEILKSDDVGAPRVAYLLEALRSLQANLQHHGSDLLIRHGDPVKELRSLAKESGAKHLVYNQDIEPFALKRDAEVDAMAHKAGLDVMACQDLMIHDGQAVLKGDGTPYVVFSPYAKNWRKLPLPPTPKVAKFASPEIGSFKSKSIPTLESLGRTLDVPMIPAGERAARKSMDDFLKKRVDQYHSTRNFPYKDTTSRLSTHLRFGTVAGRTLLHKAMLLREVAADKQVWKEIDTFISEMIWREFYKMILLHFPHVAEGCFRKEYDRLEWQNNQEWFSAWCEGRTGYPIVDAGMRQLNETGWMHNRLRMITASFLTKDLLVDWRWGEKYFMQKLYDGDLAANNGGWQWAAGTGTDAQPYFRIFNPESQAKKFDTEGHFIEKYIPEVNDFTKYPSPIVDHKVQREAALAMFKKLKEFKQEPSWEKVDS